MNFRIPPGAASLVMVLIASFAQGLSAQNDTVRIPYVVACSTCKIVYDLVGEVGNERDPELISTWPILARDRFGRIYATGYENTSVIAFDSSGRFLRTVGRQGRGPGEFGTKINHMNVVGDSLVVFGTSGRIVVYSPNFTTVRTADMPGNPFSNTVLNLRDGNVVRDGRIPGPLKPKVLDVFQLYGAKGELIRSLGVPAPKLLEGGSLETSLRRVAVTPRHDMIWIWSYYRYRGELWSLSTGTRLRDMVVTGLPWSPLNEADLVADLAQLTAARNDAVACVLNTTCAPPRTPRAPTPTSNTSILRVDDRNRLWIATEIAFKPGEQPTGTAADCRTRLQKAVEGWTKCARIDVIDETTRKLILSQLMEPNLTHLAGTDLFYRITESATGVVHISVHRARLIE